MAFKNNGRNGKGAPKGAHFASAGSAPHGFTPSAEPPDQSDDLFESGSAPRPIGVDPAETGSFEKLPSGTGVIMTNRDNADQAADAARKSLSGTTGMMRLDATDLPEIEAHKVEKHTSKPVIAILAVLALAVICLGFWLFKGVVDSQRNAGGDSGSAAGQTQGEFVTYRDITYSVVQKDGGAYQLLQSGEKCACRLNEEISVTQPTMSHHMKVLCDSGIVVGRKEGKWMHYSISQEGAKAAVEILSQLTNVQTEQKESCC